MAVTPPYSPSREINGVVYISGHTGTDLQTKLIAKDITSQTRYCLNAIAATLANHGLTMQDVIKTTVFLKDMDDFAAMNEEYAKHFDQPYPARSTVEVACLPKIALNAPLLVEIEAIAVRTSR